MEKVAKAVETIGRFREGAEKARESIKQAQEQLGAMGEGLEKIKDLDTTPKAQTVSEAVKVLSGLKQNDADLKAIRESLHDVKEADLETLPKAVVARAEENKTEVAEAKVNADLSEHGRRKSMGSLLDAYNAQDAATPIREHRLTGHGAYFSNLSHLLGVEAPDPTMIDTLGEGGVGRVLAHAFVNAMTSERLQSVRAALSEHHVNEQRAIADAAVLEAKELFNAADNVEIMPIDGMYSMMSVETEN